jgi:prepilin-type N-terminal cleavage/methylation domain-containing protein
MALTSKREATLPTATLPISKWKERSNDDAGFTLVEMLVVVVVLALLAAVVATRWSGVHHGAVAESMRSKLQFVDQHLRQFARSRHRTCLLTFDLEKSQVGKERSLDGHDAPQWESLGTGVRIDAMRVGVDKPTGRQVEISVDVNGQTPTYGLHLIGPGKRETWLLFAGVSGQMTELKDQRAWNAAFELLASPSL